ncbi:DUF262 domain-containing protein [Cronbergia sp. UHCC 0137]|uniref:DUF262 domain-containing protein n=1 Tax=Cronbergia sp. UHCC 0137 TaxID=3110239 RepID=UPI003A4C5F2F
MTDIHNLNSKIIDPDIIIESEILDDFSEDDDENIITAEDINEPFDPTKIRVETRQVSIDELLARISYHQLELEPKFQRKKVWNKIAQSRLIESILLRIPLPAFYIDATNEEKWLVIDGLHRLNSLKEFINHIIVIHSSAFHFLSETTFVSVFTIESIESNTS